MPDFNYFLRSLGKVFSVREILFSISFITLFTGFALAQPPELRMCYYLKSDGILSSYINDVAQDSVGFIWVATRNGLYKFDGYTFKPYFNQIDDSTSLPNNHVTSLFVRSDGVLFIGTQQGLSIYNEQKDNFTSLATLNDYRGLHTLQITKISSDTNGNILVAGGNSIYRYDSESLIFHDIVQIPEVFITAFQTDLHNNIWIACRGGKGLFQYKQLNKSLTPYQLNELNGRYLSNPISGLALDGNMLWISMLGEGIISLDIMNGKTERIIPKNSDEAMAVNVILDNAGQLWSIDYTGLKYIDKKTRVQYGYYPIAQDPQTVRMSLNCIFRDVQGYYWIFHKPGGIGISMANKGFRHFTSRETDFWHTSGPNVLSLQEDSSGNLWIGNGTNGLDVFDWQQGTTHRYKHDENNKNSIGRGAVQCIFRDSKGTMWIGTYRGGLNKFEPNSKKFIRYEHNPDNSNSLAGNDIRSIAEDKDGNLWIAVHGKGVDRFIKSENKFIHYNFENSKLSNDWTFQLLFDNQENLWVATAWGLSVKLKNSSTFEAYFSDVNDKNSLTSNEINTIHFDSKNKLWIGTPNGLNVFDPASKKFKNYINLLSGNQISAIQSTKDNVLWISTLSGLSSLDPGKNQVRNFTSADGIHSDEYNARSIYKNNADVLFFGGVNGIDIFHPNDLKYNFFNPVVLISEIDLSGQKIRLNINSRKDFAKSERENNMVFHPNQNNITFRFLTLNMINPEMNQHAIKLEGFDKEWRNVGNQREISYTNLNPGKYIFRVIGANNDNIWNDDGASFQFEILPPWYKTIAFKVLEILIFIALIIGFAALRTRQPSAQKLILEKKVSQKTLELTEANELLKIRSENLNEVNKLLVERQYQLESQSEELKAQTENLKKANEELHSLNNTKDKLFSIIAHDLSGPFNTILGFSELLYVQFDSLKETEKLRYSKTIFNSSEKVYALLQNLLLWARAQTKKISLNPELFPVLNLINETIDLNAELIKSKSIHIQTQIVDNVEVFADREMIKTIFRNLLGNAIKFTSDKGKITFSVSSDKKRAIISVIDSGCGMEDEKIKELLSDVLIKPEQGTNGELGSGLGLTLCRDFLKLNKGTLLIESKVGKGSNFTITLPLSDQN